MVCPYLTALAVRAEGVALRAVHGEADVVGGLRVLERVRIGGELLGFGELAPNASAMSGVVFSSSWFAVATSPTSQPARVNGTHGAGVIVSGVTGCAAVAGGTGE